MSSEKKTVISSLMNSVVSRILDFFSGSIKFAKRARANKHILSSISINNNYFASSKTNAGDEGDKGRLFSPQRWRTSNLRYLF